MCGFVGVLGKVEREKMSKANDTIKHRGPDDEGYYFGNGISLGFRRLSIIDLSEAGHQPMCNEDGTLWIAHNGEVYNYIELRNELKNHTFKSKTDTETILHAYEEWGEACLKRFNGMFAFTIWDEKKHTFFVARDRFGVKPVYYANLPTGEVVVASEIKAIHALGLMKEPDPVTWATYLAYGIYGHSHRTFWKGIKALPAGHAMRCDDGKVNIWKWYELTEHVDTKWDKRSESEAMELYRNLLEDSVRLRFRSDVPVGINLSGGLDSSILLGLVQAVQGEDSDVNVFTFVTGDPHYDELPWVKQMLDRTRHPHKICLLKPEEVPELALKVQGYQDEPFGGFPTLAYSKIFEKARELGVKVLLDGQGLDEQWAGYDYYGRLPNKTALDKPVAGIVQGSLSSSAKSDCLVPEFKELAEPFMSPEPFSDSLRNFQYRDARYLKIPRALRFNDRISMMFSTELREPFLDHRLFELALSQPADRKIHDGVHKWLLRRIAKDLLPTGVIEAPKRPLQTPQREWLRGILKNWADDYIKKALAYYGDTWLSSDTVLREWKAYCEGKSDNSFYVFQWISLGLCSQLQNIR